MVLQDHNPKNEDNARETLKEEIQSENEQTERELREISLMLEQSQLEVERLAQKNASVTARLQQLHGHFDSVPREDIRVAYDDALDAQQRLFIMRGQSEKLQSDQKHFEKYKNHLDKVSEAIGTGVQTSTQAGSGGAFSTVEAIIQAQETERQRLSRQMHDGPAQALSNFILQTEIAVRLFDIDQEKAREELNTLKESATSAFQQVRDFVFELRPMMLDDLGLVPTLKRYIEAFKEQTETSIRFTVNGVERRLESYIEVIIFRAIQEILNFNVRQEQANEISVQMNITEAHIKVTVDDNGKGVFDADAVFESSGMGIKVIKDRVEMMGGFLEIDSRPGKGSQVIFQVPAGASGQSVFA
jgi:two-component system sensor histidine kinase DegS